MDGKSDLVPLQSVVENEWSTQVIFSTEDSVKGNGTAWNKEVLIAMRDL